MSAMGSEADAETTPLPPNAIRPDLATGPNLHSITSPALADHEHPLVAPQVSHFSQVPFRTIVKFWHSEQELPV
jgi:hypothetical protein